MEIKKAGQAYDKYTLTVSYGELSAMIDAMRESHTGVTADEMYHAMTWYVERLPEPGSDETGLKDPDEVDKTADHDKNSAETPADDLLDDPGEFDDADFGDETDDSDSDWPSPDDLKVGYDDNEADIDIDTHLVSPPTADEE